MAMTDPLSALWGDQTVSKYVDWLPDNADNGVFDFGAVPFLPEEDPFATIQSENFSFASADIQTESDAAFTSGLKIDGLSDPTFSSMSQPLLPLPATPIPTLPASGPPQSNQNKNRRASPHSSTESNDTPHHESEDGDDVEEEQSKRRHNANERRRQATLNDTITQIKEIIFSHLTCHKRLSKGAVLKKTVDYLNQKNSQCACLQKENAAIRLENENLTKHVHLLNAILRAHDLKPPSFSSELVTSRLYDEDLSQQQVPSTQTFTGRPGTALFVVFVFCISAYALSGANLDIDGEYFTARALQALKMPDLSSEYIALAFGDIIGRVISTWLFFVTAYLKFVALFTMISFIKQMCEPVIRDDDSMALVFHNHISNAESNYALGNFGETEFHIKEANNLLGINHDQTPASFVSQSIAVLKLVFEILRCISHRAMIGVWADQLVVYIRGTKQYNLDMAKLLALESQRNSMGRLHRNNSLLIPTQLLMLLNNADVAGPSANTFFALGFMGLAWYIRFTPSNINDYSKYVLYHCLKPISNAFHQFAWFRLSNTDADTRLSLGRFYMYNGLDLFSQGRLQDAIFSLTQAMDIHQHSKSLAFWRANLFFLFCVFFYQESYQQALRLLRRVEGSFKKDSISNQFEYSMLSLQTMIMLKVSTNKADAHGALVAISKRYNDTVRPKVNKMEGLLGVALGLCRYRCGDIAGAWEIVKSGTVLASWCMPFFELITLEGYCELVILLLDCKINNVSASDQLPSRQEVEQYVTAALEIMNKFSCLYPVSKPTYYMRNAMYLNIIGQQQKARVQLQQAQKSAREMKLQVQLKYASRALEQLENDLNLQKNYSTVLSIQA